MALNTQCKKSRTGDLGVPCKYFRNTPTGELAPNNTPWNPPMDIEELNRIGEKNGICPYYMQKTRCEVADVVLMPYNYIIDPKIRENFDIDYENSVIIFDEVREGSNLT